MSLFIHDLLDLNQTEHAALLANCKYPWEVVPKIGDYLKKNLRPGNLGRVSAGAVIEGDVFIGEGSVIEPHVYLKGPAWIGKNCQIRHGAYLRGNVIVGDHCVLGNSCEFKNSLLLNEVQVPHFAYVGDSILGYRVHLGSGVTLSNLKMTQGNVELITDRNKIDTGLRKFGAVLGDYAEVGCHSVLNPGSVIGRHTIIYSSVSWRGVCPPNTVVKLRQQQELIARKK